MKNSSKLPIGTAIVLTLIIAGMQKASALTPAVSEAEAKQEKSVSQEVTRHKEIPQKSRANETSDALLTNVSKETQTILTDKSSSDTEKAEPKTSKIEIPAKEDEKSENLQSDEIKKDGNYTVEFTYDDLQYVLKGGKSVKLAEILKKVGLNGIPTEVVSSNDELFTAEKETGEWIIKSKKAFCTKENLSVVIDHIRYNILVTDASIIDSGTIDDTDISWTLDDEGTLTISGTGDMPADTSPWGTEITSVIIKSGITSIGKLAFSDSKLTTVSIPSTVTTIGEFAFSRCNNLTSVKIPNGVTTLNEGAFRWCSNLSSVELPDDITTIGYLAFTGCSNLSSIAIQGNNTTIVDMAFYDCKNLKNVVISNNIRYIGINAFQNTHADMNVYYQGTKTEFEAKSSGAFPGTAAENFHYESFMKCGENVYAMPIIEGTLRIFGTGDMYDLENGWDYPYYSYKDSTEKVIISDGVTSIGKGAFLWSKTNSIEIPKSVTKIGEHAFDACKNLTSAVIPEGVTSIGNNTFEECESLVSVVMPSTITSIGQLAFLGCSSLSSVVIPEGATTDIAYRTFYGCSSLSNITMSEGVSAIGQEAFYNCSSLTSVTIPGTATEIGQSAFSGCTNLSSVEILNGVTNIGSYAFNGCENLSTITMPDSIETIAGGAFADCTSLSNIVLPSGLTTVGEYAFNGCALASIAIPDGTAAIGARAFQGNNLSRVDIAQSVTSIGYAAFAGTPNDMHVYYPGTKEEFDEKFNVENSFPNAENQHFHFKQNISFNGVYEDSLTKGYTTETFSTPLNEGYEIREGDSVAYSSDNENVAVASANGKITLMGIGKAKITATVPETDNYLETSKSYALTVNKGNLNLGLTITGWEYDGTTHLENELYPNNPQVTNNAGGGAQSFYYKKQTEIDYSTDKPINAGNYNGKVIVAQTDYYNSGEATTTFKIEKAELRNLSVTIEGWTYDGTSHANPVLTGNDGGGNVEYTYTLNNYFAGPPTEAGEYKVTATVEETENYKSGTAESTFMISKAKSTAQIVTSATIVKGANTVNLSNNVSSVPSGAIVSYSIVTPLQGCSVSEAGVFTSGNISGTCVVRVTVGETNNYLPTNSDITITVTDKQNVDLDVSQDSMRYGDGTLNPPSYIKPSEEGTESITYEGTLRNGISYGPTSEMPKNAGEYLVKVIYETLDKIYSGIARFVISPREIANAIITLADNLTYNGQEQTQTVSSIVLEDKDITDSCELKDNVALNAGDYILTATAKDTSNYSGFATKEFKIAKASSDVGEVSADEVKNTFDKSAVVFHRQNETVPGTFSLIEDKLLYGTNTYNWVFTPEDTVNYESASGIVDITVSGTYYNANEGEITNWQPDSEEPLRFVFKRMLNDEDSFNHLVAINVDNQRVPEVYYEKHRGSVIIDLSPKYLETLPEGKHTLSAVFDDGEVIDAYFTVTDKNTAPETKPEAKTEGNTNESKIVKVIKTGDSSNVSFWATLFASTPIGYCLNAFSNKRRKKK